MIKNVVFHPKWKKKKISS